MHAVLIGYGHTMTIQVLWPRRFLLIATFLQRKENFNHR
jgi:hypothetical protein